MTCWLSERFNLYADLIYCVVVTQLSPSSVELKLNKILALFTIEVQVKVCIVVERNLEVIARYLRLQVFQQYKFGSERLLFFG